MRRDWIRADLHTHTVHSLDGSITFDGLVRRARRCSLDVIAVTDHDTIQGAREFATAARRLAPELHIVIGEERTLGDGSHVIGLFLREPLSGSNLQEALEEIRSQGAVCIIPHPYRHRDGLLCSDATELPHFMELLPGRAAFELFNPKCSYAENLRARGLVGEGLAPVGGSDAHYCADLGEAVNLFPFEEDIEAGIRRSIARGYGHTVLGIRQSSDAPGRKYASMYYRIRPIAAVPRPLVPLARKCYRFYRDEMTHDAVPKLEQKNDR